MYRAILAVMAALLSLLGVELFTSSSHAAVTTATAKFTKAAPTNIERAVQAKTSPRRPPKPRTPIWTTTTSTTAPPTTSPSTTLPPADTPPSDTPPAETPPTTTPPSDPPTTTIPPAAAPTVACPQTTPGFSYSFWNPYDNWTSAQVSEEIARQQSVGENGLILDYAVDQEANAAWYPSTLGYSYFENTLPTVVSATHAAGMPLWMGLIVSPTLFADNGNSWSFLEAELPKFEAVADELYNQYGSEIYGWYVPTEPTQSNFATSDLAHQYGTWLGQLTGYLHSHDGDKQVMIAAEMPSASLSGITPTQYAQELAPAMAVAGIDVWNVEDGFGMTGWTPAEEAAGFTVLQQEAATYHTAVWGDVYTPSDATPAQFEPYLQAIAATGTHQLSQWTFEEYMDPASTGSNAAAASDFSQYQGYCGS